MSENNANRQRKETPWSKTSICNRRSSLAYLLDPIDEAVFLRDYWGQKPFVRTGSDRLRMDGLFDITDLEDYLFVAKPPFGDVDLYRDNAYPPANRLAGLRSSSYSVQALYAALSEGYTMEIKMLHERWPAIRRLVDDLETRLLTPGRATAFVTSPHSHGFHPHTDSVDVIVVQTVGSKHWVIYDKVGGGTRHELDLHAGDMLYIPHGLLHSAETLDEHSIHVSLTFIPLTWKTLAQKCLDFMASQQRRWDETVPHPILQGEGGAAMLAEIVDRFREGLSNLSDVTPVVERHRQIIDARERRKNPPPSDYAPSMLHLDRLDPATEVERRPGVGCYVTTDENSATIQFMGDLIRCPPSTAHALRFVATTSRFRIDQIDDEMSDASKIVLIRRLIREGLLQCAASAG